MRRADDRRLGGRVVEGRPHRRAEAGAGVVARTAGRRVDTHGRAADASTRTVAARDRPATTGEGLPAPAGTTKGSVRITVTRALPRG
nr:hypothetical protein GCM10025699_67730 [Microbacterium flavescens]